MNPRVEMLYLSFSISLLKRATNVTFSLLDEHFGLYRTAVVALPLPSGKAAAAVRQSNE